MCEIKAAVHPNGLFTVLVVHKGPLPSPTVALNYGLAEFVAQMA